MADPEVERLMRAINEAVEIGLKKDGKDLLFLVRDRLRIPVGRDKHGVTVRSKPGESPRKETGRLQSSIEWRVEKTGTDRFLMRVFSDVFYAELEYGMPPIKARPYFRPAALAFQRVMNQRWQLHLRNIKT